jgi:hypothetical protein
METDVVCHIKSDISIVSSVVQAEIAHVDSIPGILAKHTQIADVVVYIEVQHYSVKGCVTREERA